MHIQRIKLNNTAQMASIVRLDIAAGGLLFSSSLCIHRAPHGMPALLHFPVPT